MRWTRNGLTKRYQLPQDKCPHCGNYGYSVHQVSYLGLTDGQTWDECQICGFAKDHPNES